MNNLQNRYQQFKEQLSGYSYVSTIWRLLAALIPFAILCLLSFLAGIIIIGFSVA